MSDVPECQFRPVAGASLVEDRPQHVSDDVVRRTDDVCHFVIFHSVRNQRDDSHLSRCGHTRTVEVLVYVQVLVFNVESQSDSLLGGIEPSVSAIT